jgi:hypothetical protein
MDIIFDAGITYDTETESAMVFPIPSVILHVDQKDRVWSLTIAWLIFAVDIGFFF